MTMTESATPASAQPRLRRKNLFLLSASMLLVNASPILATALPFALVISAVPCCEPLTQS
jgi:hypothetical protein